MMRVPDGNTGDWLTENIAATGTGGAPHDLREWRLRVGWIGQAFNIVTGGWWACFMLDDPKPLPFKGEKG